MTSILSKFKALAIVVMVFSFFMVTLNSCTSEKGSETTEAAADEEHPTDAAEDEEHPTDSEEGEEHPADSTKEEHPTKEDK